MSLLRSACVALMLTTASAASVSAQAINGNAAADIKASTSAATSASTFAPIPSTSAANASTLASTSTTLATTSASTTATQATSDSSTYKIEKNSNEFGFWAGGAFNATTIFGGITDQEAEGRKLLLVGLRYGRTFAATKRVSYQYTFDAIPVAVAFHDLVNRTQGTVTITTRENVYGAGITPLGFQVNFGQQKKVKPFVHINGGLLIFTEPVPLPDAGKFAYVGETGTGVRVFTSQDRALTFGFKFHHISNGDRSGSNRGLNSFVFYAGFSIFK